MSKIQQSVIKFFNYLKTFEQFYGNECITLPAFLTLYLDYDTDYNPLRNAILSKTKKNEVQINKDCLNFIVQNNECAIESFLNADEYFGSSIKVSGTLENALRCSFEKLYQCSLHHFIYFFITGCEDSARDTLREYFRASFDLDVDTIMIQVWESNLKSNCNTDFVLPKRMESYAKVLDGKRPDYQFNLMEETKDIAWNTFKKSFANNILLISEYESFPDTLVYNMAYQVEHQKTEPLRQEKIFIHIDVQDIVVEHYSNEDMVRHLKEMVEDILSLKNYKQIVIYFENIDLLMIQKDGYSYLYLLLPVFNNENIRVIVNMSASEYLILIKDWRFAKCFYAIAFNEAVREEIIPATLSTIIRTSIYHGVLISYEMIDTAILFAKALESDEILPGLRNVIDFAMGVAKSKGKLEVDVDDFIENFKFEFSEYEKQSDELKELIAYHEAGHYVVSRFCEHYTAVYTELISIISTAEFGGVNIMEYDSSMVKDYGYDFYLESLAVSLAGRAAEELFISRISSGAESDLQAATELATNMISTLGLDQEATIKGNENLKSEKSLNEVAGKVNDLMDKAYSLALSSLDKHEEYVHTLAELLLEKKIVSRNEILKLEYEEDGIVKLKRGDN